MSGGLDSMVMLDLFSNTDFKFSVAHCNYGLRGEESDMDEKLVKEESHKRGVECTAKKIEIIGSIQLEARNHRYEWFNELIEEKGCSKICTAHHLDDSLETTLFNVVRGTGIKGMKGIPMESGKTIRPLLFASKEELLQYAKDLNLKWREDATNQKTDYNRNKIRLNVVPILKELNTSLLKTYTNTKERLELTADFIQDYCAKVKDQHFDSQKSELGIDWISQDSDLIILSEILSEYGFNYSTAREVFESKGDAGKTFPGSGFTIYMDRASLFIKKDIREAAVKQVINEMGEYQVGNILFSLDKLSRTEIQIEENKDIALLDAEKVIFPLVVRAWQEGDHFNPFGMEGTKKVSDFLVDTKVPRAEKNEVLVVEDQEKIVWVVGMRISERCKIKTSTKEVLRIRRL
ncbi:MAG: tRNA lysidine(34) synthetase TilS [Bacteroidota bacterium]